MFRAEWQAERGNQPLQRIAIVDENPAKQFLSAEFTLFQRLFIRHGIDAVIAAPQDLIWDGAQLRHQGEVIHLIYNRLTDFALGARANAALRGAYLADAVAVLTVPAARVASQVYRQVSVPGSSRPSVSPRKPR